MSIWSTAKKKIEGATSGATRTIRDVFDANTEADIARRTAKGQPRLYDDQQKQNPQEIRVPYATPKAPERSTISKLWDQINMSDNNRTYKQATPTNSSSLFTDTKRKLNTGATSVARSTTGIAQDLSGAYDLITPGKGTNRFTKKAVETGKQIDEFVDKKDYSTGQYKAGQVPHQIASFMIPGSVVGKSTKLAEAPRIISKGVPLVTNVASDVIQNAGNRTSKGEDNSVKTVAIDAATSLATQGAISGGQKVIKKAVDPIKDALRKAGKIKPFDLSGEELAALAKWRNTMGTGAITDEATYNNGRIVADKLGIDYRKADEIDAVLGDMTTFNTRQSQKVPLKDQLVEILKTPRNEIGAIGKNVLEDSPQADIPNFDSYPNNTPKESSTKSIADLMPDLASRPKVTESKDLLLSKQYGVKEETIKRLRGKYGSEKTDLILARTSDATNIKNKDAFVTSEAQKAYGTPEVKIDRTMSPEELASLEATAPVQAIDTPTVDAPVEALPNKGELQVKLEAAPDPTTASFEEANAFIGDITETVTRGTQSLDEYLKTKGSSFERFAREIQDANRNGNEPSAETKMLYDKFIKPSMDRVRKFSGIETGEQKYYLPQSRGNVDKDMQAGSSLISSIDRYDFGFSNKRTNAIPLDELDYTPDALVRYFTQASSVPYKKQIAVDELIQKQATDGINLTPEQATQIIDKQEVIAEKAAKAIEDGGQVEKLDLVEDLAKLGEIRGKTKMPITERVGTVERMVRDSTTILERVPYTTTDGRSTTIFDGSGMQRYRDAGAVGQTIHNEVFEPGTGWFDEATVRARLEEDMLDADILQSSKEVVINEAMRRLKRVGQDFDGEELILEQQLTLMQAQRNIAREQLSEFIQGTDIKDTDLKKIINYHAQRMLLNEKRTRSIASKVTDGIVATYYRGALGYNPLSAFQNITENKRAVALFGAKDATGAMGKAIKDPDIIKRYGVENTQFGDLMRERTGTSKSFGEKFDDTTKLMAMFQKTESFKDATLLHGLEAKYKAQGLESTDLTRKVLDDFNKYAIKYGQFGSVGYNKTKTGRLLFQFMQFTLKDAQITLGEAGKAFKGDTDAVKYLTRLGVSNIPIYLAMSAAVGSSWQYVFGLQNPVQTTPTDAGAGTDEKIVAKLPGGPFVDGMKDLYLGFRKEQRDAQEQDRETNLKNVLTDAIKKDAALLVPAGNQIINKTGGFITDQKRGYNESPDRTNDGINDSRARFGSADTFIDKARGAVTGRYSTSKAREYFGTSGVAGDLPGRGGERQVPVSKPFQVKIDNAKGDAKEVNRLIDASREQTNDKKAFFKENPTLKGAYDEMVKTTFNADTKKRESDVISPEKWAKVYGDSSLKLYGFLKEKAEANAKEFGYAVDPIYKLPSTKQVKEVLNLRSRATGDDIEREEILRATSDWYTNFEKAEADYYKTFTGAEGDGDFGNSERKQAYADLKYPEQTETMKQYYTIKEQNPDGAKAFFKDNKDTLSAEFDQYRNERLKWINAKRELEGFAPLDPTVFNNVTFGYENDEKKVAAELSAKLNQGGGGGVSMIRGDYGQKRALNLPSAKIKSGTVKIKKTKPKTVKIQRKK